MHAGVPVADLGEGHGESALPSPSLFLDQTKGLSLGLSCFVVIHVTFSVAKVSGSRRVVSLVWAMNSKGGERKSEIWFDQLNISVINSTS